MVQWLRLCTPSAGDVSLIPGQGSKISRAAHTHTYTHAHTHNTHTHTHTHTHTYIYMREREVSFCAWNKELNTKIFGRA